MFSFRRGKTEDVSLNPVSLPVLGCGISVARSYMRVAHIVSSPSESDDRVESRTGHRRNQRTRSNPSTRPKSLSWTPRLVNGVVVHWNIYTTSWRDDDDEYIIHRHICLGGLSSSSENELDAKDYATHYSIVPMWTTFRAQDKLWVQATARQPFTWLIITQLPPRLSFMILEFISSQSIMCQSDCIGGQSTQGTYCNDQTGWPLSNGSFDACGVPALHTNSHLWTHVCTQTFDQMYIKIIYRRLQMNLSARGSAPRTEDRI